MPKNTTALINYFRQFDIDAALIKESGMDETGYDYIVVDSDGRPRYTGHFQLQTTRQEWPTPDAYEDVLHLLAGGDESGLARNKKKAPVVKDPVPDEAPVVEDPKPAPKTRTVKKA